MLACPLNNKYSVLNIGICGAIGGNTDNDVNAGTFYFNLNNTSGNRSTEINGKHKFFKTSDNKFLSLKEE